MKKSWKFLITILLIGVGLYIAPLPTHAWEESDKVAFEQKISIIGEVIVDQSKKIKGKDDERTQCLLQSIGIDVIHRYLELNPGDAVWRKKYSELRDTMTVCLAILYQGPKYRVQ